MLPCMVCGSDEHCYAGCRCLACTKPNDYRNWRYTEPEQYAAWANRQVAMRGIIDAMSELECVLTDAAADNIIDGGLYARAVQLFEEAHPWINDLLMTARIDDVRIARMHRMEQGKLWQ